MYVLWASGEVQPWNYPSESSIENGSRKSVTSNVEKVEFKKEEPLEANIKLKE